ncbi:hypothetical protein HMPREF1624_06584 [Sporothrix schenckii ATCC 58251]|uniref:N-acetyltransferase domain-containing protein n=1 Tax=Sporothrix schenckii (strain ATCC 58251 / de Perez 2211183) TaxID=1391915 RepID=U7PNN7_SPOS1|nr:hypothetical protein HMPREF1624_06584 [Sporothrix schenckii ATCC 58251]
MDATGDGVANLATFWNREARLASTKYPHDLSTSSPLGIIVQKPLEQPRRRLELTSDSLAAAAEEFSKQDTLLLEASAGKGKGRAHGKKETTENEEIVPSDSVSADGANCIEADDPAWKGTPSASTGGLWTRRAMHLFPSETDFRHCVKGWLATIHKTNPLSEEEFQTWVAYDTVPDSVTTQLLPPPQAPETRLDPESTGDKDLDERAATQTANTSCGLPSKGIAIRASDPDPPKRAPPVERETRFVHVSQQPIQDVGAGKQTVTVQKKKPTVTFETGKQVKVPVTPSTQKIEPQAQLQTKNQPPPQPQAHAERHEPKPVPELSSATGEPFPSMYAQIVASGDRHIEGIRDVYNEEVTNGAQGLGCNPATSEDIRRLYKASLNTKSPSVVALLNDKDNEQVIGFAIVHPRPGVGFGEAATTLCAECNVFVLPKYRNRGLGQELLRRVLAKTIDVSTFGPLPAPHYIYMTVACGSGDGLAEKKYIASLTTKFGFEYFGKPVETIKWSGKGPYAVKHMVFYRRCMPTPTSEAILGGAVQNIGLSRNGHTQQQAKVQGVVQADMQPITQPLAQQVVPPTAHAVGSLMSAPIAGMKYNLAHGKESISRSRFHEQLLQDLVSVPAAASSNTTLSGLKNSNRVPSANNIKTPADTEFW